jgi:DNA-binding XRE family transcriptional regulator
MKNNLKKFRKKAKWSLQDLGDICGVTRAALSLLERGDRESPKLNTAYAIAKAFNVSVYEIWPEK